MKLDKAQIAQLHAALLDGYDEESLRLMVRLQLGEDLAAITQGGTLKARCLQPDRVGRAQRAGLRAHRRRPRRSAGQWGDPAGVGGSAAVAPGADRVVAGGRRAGPSRT